MAQMEDVILIGMLRSYVNATLVGMGALKGAPCQLKSATDNGDGTQTLVFEYEDNNGDTQDYSVYVPSAIYNFTNLQNGDAMKYNATSGKWENSAIAFNCDLEDLDDVQITSLADGQIVKWDATAGKWKNADLTVVGDLDDLSDVTISSASNNQVLSWNGTAWVNRSLGAAAEKGVTSSVTENSQDLLTSGGAFTALADKADTADLGTAAAKDYTSSVTENSTDLVEGGGVFTAINSAIGGLDKSDSAVAGKYVTEVSEADGIITVVREEGDATPTENSTKMLKSGGAFTALAGKASSISVNGGTAQSVSNGAIDLDVASNLITEAQWTNIESTLV